MEHQQALMEAAEAGDINGLYNCIQEDQRILDHIDEIPFVETPLHTAASAGHHLFALEMLRLKPSFGRKLKPNGLSPLDLALRNRHYGTVKRLIDIDKELIRVKGRESLTPLHNVVAETDEIDLLAEFLCACPASIEDKTIRDETALHIAVKNFKSEAFKVLLGWLRRTYQHPLEKMLNLADDEGNNVLHIAVSTSQPQIVKLLVEKTRMNKNKENRAGLTAFDIAAELDPGPAKIEIENILHGRRGVLEIENNNNNNIYTLADFLMSPRGSLEAAVGWIFRMKRRLSLEKAYINMVLVVAVLLTTAPFQAILSPPGGNDIDNDVLFYLIYGFNTLAFMCSAIVIMVVLCLVPFGALLQIALLCLTFSYGLSFHFISPSQFYAHISFFVVYLACFIIPYSSPALWVFKRERFEMLRRCFLNY